MMTEDRESFIVHYRRTPFSRSRPSEPDRDQFNSIRMDEALSLLIKNAVSSTGIKPEAIDDAILGCALQADENWMYGGRHPVLLSNLSVRIPAMALDRACSSSLNAISIASMEIATGNADIVLAGGMEHMTHVPLNGNPHIKPNIKLLVRPEYAKLDMNVGYNMGLTAEKLADLKNIQREEITGTDGLNSQLERFLRDAKILEIWEGTSEIEKLVVARNLLKEGSVN